MQRVDPDQFSEERAEPLSPTRFGPFEFDEIPPRQWIIPGLLARTFVTGVVSPGGIGKTQLFASVCLAIRSGNEKLIGLPINERTGVWYWNQEDDTNELKRRLAATMQHFGITWEDLGDGLYVDSGVEKPLIIAKRDGGRIVQAKQVDEVITQIRDRNIGVFAFDPLVEFHEAEENDNVEMRAVMACARRIAVEGQCAVLMAALLCWGCRFTPRGRLARQRHADGIHVLFNEPQGS